jgi:hypothetical protein
MSDQVKIILSSVLFLDMAEYYKKSDSGQISLKERFNAYLSVAIRDVPIGDRLILHTGDGAALSFLGDVGDALQAAMRMRESLRDGMQMEPPLLVRMGINIGPVRLVRDINGQPNIVGDGINVAQRVMGFADPGQILVSRSYYDAVSRLSPEFAGMFRYQGSRTDKHVREHEIYAIGYPGEFTGTLTLFRDAGGSKGELSRLSKKLGESWRSAVAAFRQASPLKRIVYAGAPLVPVLAGIVLGSAMWGSAATSVPQKQDAGQVALLAPQITPVVPVSSVVAAVPVSAGVRTGWHARANEHVKKALWKPGATSRQALLRVVCAEGSGVFVDGQPKSRIGKSPMLLPVDPGRHLVLLTSASRIYSKEMEIRGGRIIRVSPDFCSKTA